MQRWVQNEAPPLADDEVNSINGAMSCDWEPPYSYNPDNLFSAFLPWISYHLASLLRNWNLSAWSPHSAYYKTGITTMTGVSTLHWEPLAGSPKPPQTPPKPPATRPPCYDDNSRASA